MARKVIIALILSLLISSCAVDPRKQAQADATRIAAEQSARDAEQRRQFEADDHAQTMQDREAIQSEWQAAWNAVIRTGALFAQFAVMLWLIGLGVAGPWAMAATMKAYSTYAQRRAETLADLIPLDPKTHAFPILPIRIGRDIVALANPNDNSVLLFDEKNPADRAKVQMMANVLFAGELARNARMSHRPGEVASIPQTQIIDGENG